MQGCAYLLDFSDYTPYDTNLFLHGETSSYVAPYRYTSGSSKSCSGAEVDDPDLHENIRICYPYGNYEYDNIIYVEKKINILGAVVTYAQTARDDTE